MLIGIGRYIAIPPSGRTKAADQLPAMVNVLISNVPGPPHADVLRRRPIGALFFRYRFRLMAAR
jgi:hypothetical protein